MVVKAYKEYLEAKKEGDGEKAYRYYSKKLNNTYSTRADRDAIEAILKKKYGSALEESVNEERKLTYNDFVRMVRDDMMAGAAPDERPSEELVGKRAKAYYNDYLQGASVDDLFEATKEEETEFHTKLDKLVHNTFGKRKGELEESSSSEEKRIAMRAIKSIAKYRGVSEDEARRDLMRAAEELGSLKEAIEDIKETIELGKNLTEELCAKGKAYRKKRMAAGEKSSAYLNGRAVKVCKGQIKG